MNTVEIMNKGMRCLTENMGVVEAEYFISIILREKFDYTKWQRDYFDSMSDEEIRMAAINYDKEHPCKGKAIRL